MDTALNVHRLHFALTIIYHYLFPQLTIGLALFIVLLKTTALRTGNAHYNRAARFWTHIFAINFAIGVVTGIPMEFQFGTNWAAFAQAAGGVIGQTLAMEGVFSFFLESTCLGLFLYGEQRLGPRGHWAVSVLLCLGAWLSGFFIVATNAWMQHPVGYRMDPDGRIHLTSFSALFTNPWLRWQYLHTMLGAVVTASIVMASVGAFYLLVRRHEVYGRTFVRLGVVTGLIAALLLAFPTGDRQARLMAMHQPVGFAAMEGVFGTVEGAGLVLIGQPDVERMRLDNPLEVPGILSFLTHRSWSAEIKGLAAFAVLAMHGALWITMKTDEGLQARSRRTALRLWWAVMGLMALVTLSTFHVQPHVWERLRAAPWGAVLPLLAVSALGLARWFCLKRCDVLAFLASVSFLGAMLVTVAFSVFPYVIPASTDPALGLTLRHAAAEPYALQVGLAWWIPGMVLVAAYFFFVYRQFAGKVRLDEEGHY